MKKMKAVICPAYGPPEVLKIIDTDKPVPMDNEVLIKVRATTVTVADFRIRSFTVPSSFWIPARIALGITKPKKPILGVELAGDIESVGKNVSRFKAGDPVFAATLSSFGGYAEYKCLPENAMISLMPKGSTYEEAAAIPTGARTALHYLRKAHIKSGQKVLIYGASGSVGTYAVQLAKYFGAHVTGVCSGTNLEMVKTLGADRVVDYTKGEFTQNLETYDLIFMAVDKWSFTASINFLKPDGVYLDVTAPVKSFSMIRTSMTTQKKIYTGEIAPDNIKDMEFLKDMVEKGILKIIIDRSYSLDEIVEAHRYVERGHKKGNVVIRVNGEAVPNPAIENYL